jgi:hypothetical protein
VAWVPSSIGFCFPRWVAILEHCSSEHDLFYAVACTVRPTNPEGIGDK